MNTPLLRLRARWCSLLLLGLLCASRAHALDPAELFEQLSPSVWVVVAADKHGITTSSGSGVVIGAERMVTNCHVLKKAASVLVKRENTAHAARLEFADVERDLCTLKIKSLLAPPVKIAPLGSVKVGQKIIVIGAPRGLELTLSDGLVSALRRNRDDAIELIQISAPISPGSSGGGLFSMNGDLLGIPSLSMKDAQNLNFAIPSEWIKDIASRSEFAEIKRKEEQDKTPISRKSASAAFEEQQLKSAELIALVNKAMGLSANGANDPEGRANIDISNVARPMISLRADNSSWNARFALRSGGNELCITATYPPPPIGAVPRSNTRVRAEWTYYVQCYRVYEFEPDKFALREREATANAFVIDVK